MAITAQTPYTNHMGNGTTTIFAYTFTIFDESDMAVYVDGILKTLTTDYSISNVGSGSGGNVTFVSAPTSGKVVRFVREMPYDREVDYQTSGDLLADTLDNDLDRLECQIQQLGYAIDRAMSYPNSDASSVTGVLPSATDRAEKVLYFDSTGKPTAVSISVFNNIIAGANYVVDAFTGDGVTKNFVLSIAPGTRSNTDVHIDGVYQNKEGYALTDTVLTFSEAPYSGADIEVVSGDAIPEGFAGNATAVRYVPSGTGAVETNVAAKLRESVSVKDFGAVGDGVTDDTAAIQAAIDSGQSIDTNGLVLGIAAELVASSPNITITGGGTIKFLATYDKSGGTLSALAVTAQNVTIDAVTFDGSAVTGAATNNRFVWCTAPRLNVTSNASFISLPSGGGNFNGAIGCSSMAPYARVIGAYFNDNPGAIFFQGRNCVAQGNVIINPQDVAIALNGSNCYGCVVVGNTINNEVPNSCSALIAAEEAASQWTIEGNTLFGVKDGIGIAALNVAVTTQASGGKIIGNIVNGGSGTTTNPAALIACSQYYNDVEISSNTLLGMPTGNANSRLIICAATGGSVHDNVIDGASATGIGANVLINNGARGILIQNNTSYATATGRHFLFGAGDYGNVSCQFIGGKFYSGSEGINSELNAGSITNFKLYIDNISDNSSTSIVNAATALGDRASWLNAGAWARRPCHIGIFTNMYGSGVPTSGSFFNGDTVYYLAPSAGGKIGFVRAGGAWKEFGEIDT